MTEQQKEIKVRLNFSVPVNMRKNCHIVRQHLGLTLEGFCTKILNDGLLKEAEIHRIELI